MVTNEQTNNRVNLEQVCSLNIEQSRLLQFLSFSWILFGATWSRVGETIQKVKIITWAFQITHRIRWRFWFNFKIITFSAFQKRSKVALLVNKTVCKLATALTNRFGNIGSPPYVYMISYKTLILGRTTASSCRGSRTKATSIRRKGLKGSRRIQKKSWAKGENGTWSS